MRIDGFEVLIKPCDKPRITLYLIGDELEDSLLKEYKDILVVSILSDDWNKDFSPWPMDALFKNEDFIGKGKDTLDILEQKIVPYVEDTYGKSEQRWILGYSLAGLYSLWVGYNSKMFDHIGSCSGSLWYIDWDKYINEHNILTNSSIYLSLGDKESKTKNMIMAKVESNTLKTLEAFKKDHNVYNVIYEVNQGGHFNEPEKRLLKAISWLYQN